MTAKDKSQFSDPLPNLYLLDPNWPFGSAELSPVIFLFLLLKTKKNFQVLIKRLAWSEPARPKFIPSEVKWGLGVKKKKAFLTKCRCSSRVVHTPWEQSACELQQK